jgi:hypothetical protein
MEQLLAQADDLFTGEIKKAAVGLNCSCLYVLFIVRGSNGVRQLKKQQTVYNKRSALQISVE